MYGNLEEQRERIEILIFSLPLHWTGTPGMLQARGREMARERLMGNWKGTLPVKSRHKQSMPEPVADLSELQQSADGDVPLELLFVRKFMHGVKLESIEALHGVLICPYTGTAKRMVAATNTVIRRGRGVEISMDMVFG